MRRLKTLRGVNHGMSDQRMLMTIDAECYQVQRTIQHNDRDSSASVATSF